MGYHTARQKALLVRPWYLIQAQQPIGVESLPVYPPTPTVRRSEHMGWVLLGGLDTHY